MRMWRTDRSTNPTAPTAPTAGPVIAAGATALGIARGWWIAAWCIWVVVLIAGALVGRKGQPVAYLVAGLAAGLAALISQPAWNP